MLGEMESIIPTPPTQLFRLQRAPSNPASPLTHLCKNETLTRTKWSLTGKSHVILSQQITHQTTSMYSCVTPLLPVIFLLPCRKRAERRAAARAAGWRSWRTNLTRTAPEARVSTHTRSITSANTSRPGSVPFCLKPPFEWRRSPGMPTPIREPGELNLAKSGLALKRENDSSCRYFSWLMGIRNAWSYCLRALLWKMDTEITSKHLLHVKTSVLVLWFQAAGIKQSRKTELRS